MEVLLEYEAVREIWGLRRGAMVGRAQVILVTSALSEG